MSATKPILVAVFGILLLSTIGTIVPSHAVSNAYETSYQTSQSHYVSTTTSLGTVAHYQVTNGVYSGQSGNGTMSLHVTDYVGTSSGTNSSVSLTVSSSYSDNTVKANITGNGGTLLYVAATQDGLSQVIWSGAAKINATTATSIAGLAYLNASTAAVLTLGFAGEDAIQTATSQLGAISSITVNVPQFTFSVRSSLAVSGNVTTVFPQRYKPLSLGSSSVNATGAINTPLVSVGTSAFMKANYPDMVWRGSASATASFNGTSSAGNLTTKAAEFFGANGTVVGFIRIFNLETSKLVTLGAVTVDAQNLASSTLIVSSTQPLGGSTSSTSFVINVHGQAVVIQKNNVGAISSTANVEFQHAVSVKGSSITLVILNTNMSSYALVDFSHNSSQSVNQTSPQSQKPTTIKVGSSTFAATQVNISASGNIVFNVTLPYPNVIVFKASAAGLVQLNATNYWVSSGRVYVFDDPSSTYYIANGGTSSVQTISSVSGGTGATTSSTGTATQSSGSTAIELAVGVVLALIAIGIIAVVVRRRKQ